MTIRTCNEKSWGLKLKVLIAQTSVSMAEQYFVQAVFCGWDFWGLQ